MQVEWPLLSRLVGARACVFQRGLLGANKQPSGPPAWVRPRSGSPLRLAVGICAASGREFRLSSLGLPVRWQPGVLRASVHCPFPPHPPTRTSPARRAVAAGVRAARLELLPP